MNRKVTIKPFVEIKVDDLNLFARMVCFLCRDRDIPHYSEEGIVSRGRMWVFRGQADCSWEIQSTLKRNLIAGHEPLLMTKRIEQELVRRFMRDASCHVPISNYTLFDVLSLMRHYKAPTRLVDFSESPFVALYFSIEEMSRSDFCVWAVCADELNEYPMGDDIIDVHPMKCKPCKQNEEDELRKQFEATFWAETDEGIEQKLFYAYPRLGNIRQSSQSGLFLVQTSLKTNFMDDLKSALGCDGCHLYKTAISKLYNDDRAFDVASCSRIVKFVFPRGIQEECASMLHAMNLSPRTLYPGLEGVGLSLSQCVTML